ncbi:MAG: hypothetical protein WC839_03510, partial [Candidatus Paceibacterota bacterium]
MSTKIKLYTIAVVTLLGLFGGFFFNTNTVSAQTAQCDNRTLYGNVTTGGTAIWAWFEYGPSSIGLVSSTPGQGPFYSNSQISAHVTNLTGNTSYNYQLIISNKSKGSPGAEFKYGGINNFTTPACPISTYIVTPSAGTGGSISPNSPVTVNSGSTASFSVYANSGYSINSVTGCSGRLSGSTYTTGAIYSNCNVSASFTADPITTYLVTASAGRGGTISPSSRTVNSGNTTSFSVYANSGYSINSVTGCSGRLSGSTYTTGAIYSNCNVSASF